MTRRTKILFPFLFICSLCSAQQNNPLSKAQLRQLDSIAIQDVPKNSPGIVSGIVINGKVAYQIYSGYANLRDSIKIDKHSRFNIASNGKQFTAFAILGLVEKGKLGLNDDIRKFLPKLFTKIKQKITIANLLSHTSGIRDIYDLWSIQGITWWERTFDNSDVIKLLSKQTALNFPPGTRYAYSNSNYILLAKIIEKVSGQGFVKYTDSMFKKLGMPNTSFTSDHTKIRGPVAMPYFNFDTWTGYNWICNISGDGNLFTTLEDQLQWEMLLQGKASTFFSSKSFHTSQQLIEGAKTKQYGFGLEFGTYKGAPYRFHEGSTGAWKATVVRTEKAKISIVTLTNSGKTIPSMQTRQMLDLLLKIPNKQPSFQTEPKSPSAYIDQGQLPGTYQDADGFTFQFEIRDTSLYLVRPGRNDTRLVRESANIFRQWNDRDFRQEFLVNPAGEMTVTAYYTSHQPYTLTRANADLGIFDFSSLNGNYLNQETGAKIGLDHTSKTSYQLTIGRDTVKAVLLSKEKLYAGSYRIRIAAGQTGRPKQLLLSTGRLTDIIFLPINK